jgi:hypothetical protein
MPSLAHLRVGRPSPVASIALVIAVVFIAAGCTRATVLESDASNRSTTTTVGVRPVPNGGSELPDAPTPTDESAATKTATSDTPTTAVQPVVSVKSATATKPKSSGPKTTTPPATTRPTVPAAKANSGPVTAVTSTTTTAPPASTTTTSLPANPTNIIATVSPTFATQASTQLFQFALTDPQSGPVPTDTPCAGVDYMLGSDGGYIAAPFQTALTCDTPGQILRALPANAPLGVYEFCTTLDGSPSLVCTPYYIINYSTPFQ